MDICHRDGVSRKAEKGRELQLALLPRPRTNEATYPAITRFAVTNTALRQPVITDPV
jgi:hypothetical protein